MNFNPRQVLIGSFFIACALISWQYWKADEAIPPPAKFTYAGLVYGLLGIAGAFLGPETAALMGVGYLLVLIYKTLGANLTTEGAETIGDQAGDAIPTAGSIVGSQVTSVIRLINGSPKK